MARLLLLVTVVAASLAGTAMASCADDTKKPAMGLASLDFFLRDSYPQSCGSVERPETTCDHPGDACNTVMCMCMPEIVVPEITATKPTC